MSHIATNTLLVTTLCQYNYTNIVFRGLKYLAHHGGCHGCGKEDETDGARAISRNGQDAPKVVLKHDFFLLVLIDPF